MEMEDIQITQLESAAIFKKTNFPVTLKVIILLIKINLIYVKNYNKVF